MSQSKIAYLNFFSAALLTTGAIYGLNSTKIEAAVPKAIDSTFKSTSRSLAKRKTQIKAGSLKDSPREALAIAPYSVRTGFEPTTKTLADASLANSTDGSERLGGEDGSKSRLLRLVSLTFFFLFFVPLGIFYPLFLFYRMLLIKPDESENTDGVNGILGREEDYVFKDPGESALSTTKELSRATVSKLQIAFSPPASRLREELGKVGFDADISPEYDLVSLMHQTVAVLIEQDHWTHVSYDSATLPLAKAKSGFDSISLEERKKISNQRTNPRKYINNLVGTEGYERNYSYVVVTLILCTSHPNPLFQTIGTRKQLLEELIQLGKMEKDTVIKFELLWNPQQRDEYISNDQLLIEYGDMTRLL